MGKRKYNDNENSSSSSNSDKRKSKRRRRTTKIDKNDPKLVPILAPPVNNLKELISIGETKQFYKNINSIMLWNILSDLKELDSLIGMRELKQSIFHQMLYYLQGMNENNYNQEYLHTIITGNPGCGKCLNKNTPVIMYDGTIKMVQDIKVGDKLMGDDSKVRNVTSLARGREKMYKVRQIKGDDYIVNESHILSLKLTKMNKKNTYAYINNKKYKKNDIVDISILDYLKLSKSMKSRLKGFKVGVEFEKKEIPFDPYIIGLWLGDGSCNSSVITNRDSEIIKYLYENLNKNNLYLCHHDKYSYTMKVIKDKNSERHKNNVIKNPFMEILRNLNLINNKHIPDIYKINDKKTRLKLLAGIIDSDGYYNKGVYDIIQKRKKLAYDISFLARSLGFYVNISECYKCATNTEQKRKKLYYRLTISGNLEDIPVLVKRKKASKRKQIKNVLNTGIKIEELEIDNYYGFTIDGNHRFLLGDFTVTHNTTVAKIIGNLYKNMGILSPDGKFKVAYRDNLVAEYLGQTAVKTRKLLKSCIGGVLMIDEVYALGPGQSDKDSFSKEAIDTLTSFLSEHKNDFCCIAAGYADDIEKCFFSVNKGLKRRFPWVHNIDKYSPKDLSEIFKKKIFDIYWYLDKEITDIYLESFFKNHDSSFKNFGGDIENFISKIKMFHSKRVFSLDSSNKYIITKEDMKTAIENIKKQNNVKEKSMSLKMMYV